MATTTPDTVIKLLDGVTIDPSYNHTLYFSNTTDQYNYFSSLAHVTLSDYTFQRTKPNVIRVGCTLQQARRSNYLMFTNNGFYGANIQWVYAFITDVNYINNSVTEITFEIDYIQTFLLYSEIGQCWVERQHVSDDTIFYHNEPDYMPAGSEVVEKNARVISSAWSAVVWVSETESNGVWSPVYGIARDRYVGGLEPFDFKIYDSVGVSYSVNNRGFLDLTNFVQKYIDAGKAKEIHCITFFPNDLILDNGHSEYVGIVKPTVNSPIFINVNNGTPDDSYTPKNNKCYAYPYSFLKLCTNSGEKTYRWEFMDDTTLHVIGGLSPDTSVDAFIGSTSTDSNHVYNKYNTLTIGNLPQISFTVDNFTTWLAQNQISTATQLFSNLANNNIMGGVNQLANVYQMGMFGGTSQLSTASNTSQLTLGNLAFVIKECHLDLHSIREADDYFTKYGYAINKVRTPRFNVRPHYTYVKTRDAVVIGNNGYNANKKIADILNNGITFWKNGANVGNYSLNNAPS